MASFAASGALGLGAGAALYNFGYQGMYKEDTTAAAAAASAVFVVLSVVQRLLSGTAGQPTASSTGETKKKKKKAKVESEDDDSTSDRASQSKNNASGAAKVSKPEKGASKIKAKDEKQGTKAEPDKKSEKGKAKSEAPKTEQKTTKKPEVKKEAAKEVKKAEASKEVKKGEASKDGKKGVASKTNEADKKKAKMQEVEEVDSDSADEEAFLRLGQKSSGAIPTRAPVVQPDSDEEEDSDDAPIKPEPSNTKSAIRRRKQKENKEKAAAVAVESASSKPKKVVDKDGFETVQVTKRPAKKPSAPSAGGTETKADTKAAELSTFSDSLELESKQLALLIGPKGETLNALRDACGGVRIDTPAKDSGEKTVTISGAEDSVRYCKSQIKDLITKGACSALSPGTTSAKMTVSGAALGILIGPKGSNIKKVQDAFNVRIKTPERDSNSEQIIISGQKEDVKKAKTCVQQIIEHGFSNVTHEGFQVGEVAFPRSELRHLIGPGGHTIKSIQGDTKTKVKIPAEDSENQNITVIGPAEGVAKAIKQISTLLERKAAREAAAASSAAYNSEDDDL